MVALTIELFYILIKMFNEQLCMAIAFNTFIITDKWIWHKWTQ